MVEGDQTNVRNGLVGMDGFEFDIPYARKIAGVVNEVQNTASDPANCRAMVSRGSTQAPRTPLRPPGAADVVAVAGSLGASVTAFFVF